MISKISEFLTGDMVSKYSNAVTTEKKIIQNKNKEMFFTAYCVPTTVNICG